MKHALLHGLPCCLRTAQQFGILLDLHLQLLKMHKRHLLVGPAQRTVSGVPADLDFHIRCTPFSGRLPLRRLCVCLSLSALRGTSSLASQGGPCPPRTGRAGSRSVPGAPSTHALSCPVSPVHPGFGVCLPLTADPLGSSRLGTGPPSHVHLLQALDPSVL